MGKAAKPAKAGNGKGAAAAKAAAFVDAYFAHNQNATQAAIALGYSPRSAGNQAARLMKYDGVKASIEARRHEIASKLKITAELWERRVVEIINHDPAAIMKDGKFLPIDQWPESSRMALDGIDVREVAGRGEDAVTTHITKVDFARKLPALDMAGRFLGMYARDKQGAAGAHDDDPPAAVPVTIDFKDARRRPR